MSHELNVDAFVDVRLVFHVGVKIDQTQQSHAVQEMRPFQIVTRRIVNSRMLLQLTVSVIELIFNEPGANGRMSETI